MKKFILIIGFLVELAALILMCLILFSCHSTRQTIQEKNDVSERKNIELSEMSESDTKIFRRLDTRENSSIGKNVLEKMAFTVWSPPDSLGKQYQAITGEINRRENTEQSVKKDTSENTESSVKDKEQIDFKDTTKTDSKSDIKEVNENKKKAPAWTIWPLLVIILGLIIYLFRIFKK